MRCPVLVGRGPELGALRQAFERARGGRGAWIGVVGEAGIGKTGLVTEFAGLVRQDGGRVLTGRCSSLDPSTPYRPFAEVLLALAADVPSPIPAQLAPYAAALARFVPAWRDQSLVANESPAVLGASLVRLLRWPGGGDPVVLVIEDLHWADQDTLAACEYLADHLDGTPIVVLATWRPEDVSTGPLRMLRRHRLLHLAPLTSPEVAELATECLGEPPPGPILERLARSSSGLPLLVEDLLEAGSAAPARYAALVTERLERLPPAAVPAVVAAALLGERFELSLLSTSLRTVGIDAASAMHEAMTVGLVLPEVDVGVFRFRHALTHEAVFTAAPHLRAEMSGHVATALAETGSARNLSRAAELRAGVGDRAGAVALLEQAAELFAREGTPGSALTLLDRARSLGEDQTSRLRIDRSRLDHLAALGRSDEVERLGNALLDRVSRSDGPALRVAVARASLDAGHPDRAAAHLDVAGLGHDDPACLVLRARLALQSGAGDRRLVAEHLAHQAIAASGFEGAVPCQALELAARCARSRSLDDAAHLLGRALDVAQSADLTPWRLRLLNELGTVEMLRSADGARLQRALEAARAAGALDVAVGTAVNLVALHAMRGELDVARAGARVAHEEALQLGLRPQAAA